MFGSVRSPTNRGPRAGSPRGVVDREGKPYSAVLWLSQKAQFRLALPNGRASDTDYHAAYSKRP